MDQVLRCVAVKVLWLRLLVEGVGLGFRHWALGMGGVHALVP